MDFIQAKSILSSSGKFGENWFGINYNMNLYRGCNHGCIYCDSRSDKYRVENFDKVRGKENCLETLEKELRSKRKKGVVGIGAMSDSYNRFEKEEEITRGALKLLDKYNFGVSLETKSDLVTRDIDLFKKISGKSNAIIKMTITASDDNLSKLIETNVSVSSKRFEAIQKLSESGIYTGILMTPMLPFITDTEENVKQIVEKAAKHKAKFVYGMFGVTLRGNQKEHYYKKLEENFPKTLDKYRKYPSNVYLHNSPNQKNLRKIFVEECKRYNLLYKMEDIIKAYKKEDTQLSLF